MTDILPGARVYHRDAPSILGTVVAAGAFTATIRYDNGATMRQSLSVLRAAGGGVMTLADKRKVIEVLLGASGDQRAPTVYTAAERTGAPQSIARLAARFRQAAAEINGDGYYYHHDCTEAAYRLIESLPTLGREWLGRARRRNARAGKEVDHG